MDEFIDVHVPPSGAGCAGCEQTGSWWLRLRRCTACGHVGCCELSLNRHAARHFLETGHRFVQSYEPGETWWWDFIAEEDTTGPVLAAPVHRPTGQPSPGPRGRVPPDWQSLLFERDG
jgi:hypothetical protein